MKLNGRMNVRNVLMVSALTIGIAGLSSFYAQNDVEPVEEPETEMKGTACEIYGKIKFVDYGEDYKVKKVDYGEDVKIKWVDYGEDNEGKWKEVDYGEDFKIKWLKLETIPEPYQRWFKEFFPLCVKADP